MNESSDFLEVNTKNEFILGNKAPLTLSVNYPICAIAFSSNEIGIYDIEKFTTRKLIRQVIQEQSSVLCSDISPDKTLVATGNSDGEIIIWSIESQNVLVTSKTNDSVMQIRFLNQNTLIHSDSNGAVYSSTISTKLFKKQITTVQIYNFDQPLTCLATYNSIIYTSTSNSTVIFKITPQVTVLSELEDSTLLFSFVKDTIALVIGHSVRFMNTEYHLQREIDFSGTPQSIAIVDKSTTLVMYNGTLELAVGQERFKSSAPMGLSYSIGDKIIVVGQKISVCKLASVQDRVNALIRKGNWEDAFSQLISKSDIKDLKKLFVDYTKQEKFDTETLIKTAERLNAINIITEFPFGDKNSQILRKIIENNHQVPLSRNMIEKIYELEGLDVNQVRVFIMTSALKMNFIDTLLSETIKNDKKLAGDFSLYFTGDLYFAILMNHYNKSWETVISLLRQFIIDNPTNTNMKIAIDYLTSQDLKEITQKYPNEMDDIFCTAISFDIKAQEIAETAMTVIAPESTCWDLIASSILSRKVIITDDNFWMIFDFISGAGSRLFKLRQEALLVILRSEKVDLKKLLAAAKIGNFEAVEFDIIQKIGEPELLIMAIIDHKCTTFADRLKKTVKDKLNDTLLGYCRWLIRINPQEFTDLVVESQNITFVSKVVGTLQTDSVCHWHFLKHLFATDWFCYNAQESTVLSYIRYLAKYDNKKIVYEIPRIKSAPLDKILKIVLDNGIIDASLLICQLIGDYDKAVQIATNGIVDAMMQGDYDVVNSVTHFLSSYSSDDFQNIWMQCFTSFQLPLFAFYKDKERITNVVDTFAYFIKVMTLVVDPAVVADEFTKSFSFLPFSVAKPIISAFYNAIRERNEFSKTLYNIEKDEVVRAQVDYVRDVLRGRVIDAKTCAKCRKTLGTGDAVVSKCCHVFHAECSLDCWCPICNRRFELAEKEEFITHSKILRDFDRKEPVEQKTQNKGRPKSTLQLKTPTIGEVCPVNNNNEKF